MSISEQLINISKELESLEKLTNLKSKVSKYNSLCDQINNSLKYVNNQQLSMCNSDNIDQKNIDIDEKEFISLMNSISDYNNNEKNNANKTLEDIIKQYNDMLLNIQKCEEYLSAKKLEITNLEKN
jgi:hypothetical protein